MQVIPELVGQMSGDLNNEETRIRRPPNAFMIFGKQYRKVLAQKFENLSNKQISKILGDEWKKMDQNSKSHYHSLAKEVYRTHLQKYPDYHYNPLEARQRKAERKRKYKTSRVSTKSKTSAQYICPIIKPFGGSCSNSSISFPNTTFAFSQTPTVRYIQPIVNSGTGNGNGNGDSVIGIKKLGHSFTTCDAVSRVVAPIEHKEHNYALQPKTEESFSQSVVFDDNSEQQINEIEVHTQQIDWNQSFDFLVNFLPPMLNPNTEVTPVNQNFGQSSNEEPNQPIDCQWIKREFETSEEVGHTIYSNNNAIVGQLMDVPTFIKTEIKSESIDEQLEQLFHKEAKVVVQRIDH